MIELMQEPTRPHKVSEVDRAHPNDQPPTSIWTYVSAVAFILTLWMLSDTPASSFVPETVRIAFVDALERVSPQPN